MPNRIPQPISMETGSTRLRCSMCVALTTGAMKPPICWRNDPNPTASAEPPLIWCR